MCICDRSRNASTSFAKGGPTARASVFGMWPNTVSKLCNKTMYSSGIVFVGVLCSLQHGGSRARGLREKRVIYSLFSTGLTTAVSAVASYTSAASLLQSLLPPPPLLTSSESEPPPRGLLSSSSLSGVACPSSSWRSRAEASPGAPSNGPSFGPGH